MGISTYITAWIAITLVYGQEENPSMANCGRSKVSSSGNKIVGGRNAREGEFPWQSDTLITIETSGFGQCNPLVSSFIVDPSQCRAHHLDTTTGDQMYFYSVLEQVKFKQLSLEMRMVPVVTKYQHICGASVINEQFAVTAAHCIAGGYFTTYRVSAGASNISTKATLPTKHMVIPYVHEQYNPVSSLQNDIALLRLTTPLNMQDSNGLINGVCLPPKTMADNVTGMGTVTGWGTTSEGGSLSDTLRAVDVPIITDAECRVAYEGMIEDTMICAGYEEGGKDSCQGDSGGPFVQQNSEGVSYLIGIVSWGKGCAQPKNPGVYTETAHYMDWIVRTMKTLGGSSPSVPTSSPSTPSGSSEAEQEGSNPEAAENPSPGEAANHPELPEGVVIKL